MPHLNIQPLGGGSPFRFTLEEARVQLGRTSGCDLQIADDRVSRHHAAFEMRNGRWGVEDLGSNNGTLLNGKALRAGVWTPLRTGDWLRLAREVADIEYVDPDPPDTVVRLSKTALEEGKTVWSEPDQIWLEKEQDAAPIADESSTARLERQLARVKERATRQAQHLQLLTEFSRSLSAEFSLDEVYDRCFELILQLTPADRISILRLADGEELEPVLRCRSGREALRQVAVSETIVRRAISKKKSVLWSKNLDQESQVPGSLIINGIHSVMCAPLLGRTQVLGAIYVDRQSPLHALDLQHLEVLNAVAGPTAIAVDNVLSVERLRLEEERRLSYNRFLPPHLASRLQAEPDCIELGGVNQEISVLFSDIRGFTHLSERQDPVRVLTLLNRYFSDMVNIVFQHGGTLDKFLGDGMMAIFGAPEVNPNDPLRAVRAAIGMQQRMEHLREDLEELAEAQVEIGIGINTGIATVGFLGTERRTDYTAIGDTVNIAARLESVAKPGQILISEATARAVSGTIELDSLGKTHLKGRTGEVEIYSVRWGQVTGITR
ncbi:MAG: adenylate/guanylate cyclase domain-containing protein [Planctomycetota bacterium]